jgi:hypothetical protein
MKYLALCLALSGCASAEDIVFHNPYIHWDKSLDRQPSCFIADGTKLTKC